MCAAAQQGPTAHFAQGPLADYVSNEKSCLCIK